MPARVAHAKAYPFRIPARSYLYANGAERELPPNPDLAGRTPVIACGSNRSPDQLARKYGGLADFTIPVQRAWLADFDVVYAAHITRYGSLAASLQHAPGARVEVSLIWLTPDQLDLMNGTESVGRDYYYAWLDGLALAVEGGAERDGAYAYVTKPGCLNHEGAHVAIAEVAAENRPHGAHRQEAAQALVHKRLGGSGPLDDFIVENIENPELRAARERRLQHDAHPFAWPRTRVIEG